MTQQDFKLSVDAIKKKIAALMAKAEAEGVTKEEAASFSAAAIRLATKFNLDLAEASGWKENTFSYERFETNAGRQRWRRELMATLCEYTFCRKYYITSTGTSIIIGEPHNRELVMLMYETLVKYIEPEAKKAHELYGRGVHARHWKDQYYAGFNHAIVSRLRRQKDEETQSITRDDTVLETNDAPATQEVQQMRALMVVKDHELDKAVETFIGKTSGKIRPKKYQWDTDAATHGFNAGKAAPLTNRKQIGAAS